MRTQKSADVASGLFLSLLGVVVLYAASQITGGMEERLPPRTLPYVVGSLILAGGLFLTLKTLRSRGETTTIKWPDRAGTIRIAVILLSLIAYTALIAPLGMPIATALFIAFTIWYLRRSAPLLAVTAGLLSGATVYLVFIRFLELSFPVGPWEP